MHPYISGCTHDVGGSVGEAHCEWPQVGSESISLQSSIAEQASIAELASTAI